MPKVIILLFAMFSFGSCHQNLNHSASCSQTCIAKNSKSELACRLMPEDLRKRKEIVLKSLKEKVIERKELANGYAFRFEGSDVILDELVEFIKTERNCCDFFVFNLSVSGDKTEAWLELTGVEGTKDFITDELGM